MADNPIRPDIYVDYQGKRVCFCCEMCKTSFLHNPDKYLDRLPQFAGVTAADIAEKDRARAASPLPADLAEPTGIITLCLVTLAVCLALLRRVRGLGPRLMLRLHRIVGFCALVSGAVHATVIVLSH